MRPQDPKLLLIRVKPSPVAILFSSGLTLDELQEVKDHIERAIANKKGMEPKK